jgi:hypothetical protein
MPGPVRPLNPEQLRKMQATRITNKIAAKKKALEGFALGMTIKEAMAYCGRSAKTYDNWRSQDPEFVKSMNEIRDNQNFIAAGAPAPDNASMGFAEWRKKFLNRET